PPARGPGPSRRSARRLAQSPPAGAEPRRSHARPSGPPPRHEPQTGHYAPLARHQRAGNATAQRRLGAGPATTKHAAAGTERPHLHGRRHHRKRADERAERRLSCVCHRSADYAMRAALGWVRAARAWLAAHRPPRSAQISAASAGCAVPPKTAISRTFGCPVSRLVWRQAKALPDLLLDDLRRGPRVHGVDVLLAP